MLFFVANAEGAGTARNVTARVLHGDQSGLGRLRSIGAPLIMREVSDRHEIRQKPLAYRRLR